jgi:hypothetical protein
MAVSASYWYLCNTTETNEKLAIALLAVLSEPEKRNASVAAIRIEVDSFEECSFGGQVDACSCRHRIVRCGADGHGRAFCYFRLPI